MACPNPVRIDQPAWASITDDAAAHAFCDSIGYPVIVRPSYVLSGAAMSVVRGPEELSHLLAEATSASPDHPVVISRFVEGAFEVDVDAVASGGDVVAYAISEHLERGGVHSGDATLVLPPFRLSEVAQQRLKDDTAKIASELNVSGPLNTQFLVLPMEDSEWIGVIETNLRASRSVPFVSKVLDVDFIERATACTLKIDGALKEPKCDTKPNHTGVKSPQFSFARLLGADPILGVEMHSTGEVACFGETIEEAYLKSLVSTHFELPPNGSSILVCARKGAHGSLKDAISGARSLATQGYKMLAADDETSGLLTSSGVTNDVCSADELIAKRQITLVLDLSGNHADFYSTRRSTVDFSIPLITNHEQVILFAKAMTSSTPLISRSYDEYMPTE